MHYQAATVPRREQLGCLLRWRVAVSVFTISSRVNAWPLACPSLAAAGTP
jgi:hypothetical protein